MDRGSLCGGVADLGLHRNGGTRPRLNAAPCAEPYALAVIQSPTNSRSDALA